MITENLTILCDEVLTLEPQKCTANGLSVKILLDDVQVEPLLIQLAEKLDIETVLDYFSDDAIKAYLLKGKDNE